MQPIDEWVSTAMPVLPKSAAEVAMPPPFDRDQTTTKERVERASESSSVDVNVDHISKTFAGAQGPIAALSAIKLKMARGSFVAVIGPSGCGKSTLLRIVAGLEEADLGGVFIRGEPPQEFRARGELGIAFQDPALLPWRSVEGNIALPLQVLNRPVREHQGHIQQLIELVGLGGYEKALPGQLSGGMRQRVAIARALVTNPSVLLLDEPFGALDQILRRTMNLELQRIWTARQITTLLVTHSLDEAVFLADEVVVMHSVPGRIAEIVPIPFPRPRSPELFTSTKFHQICDRLALTLYDKTEP
jgi:NitT/TauT family transport system ATP-binding protein